MGPLILALGAVLAQDSAQEPRQPTDLPARVQSVITALDGTEAGSDSENRLLTEAFGVFTAEHDAYEGEAALAVARAMHRHASATWSAFCLEGILRRLGHYEAARDVLADHLVSVSAPAERAAVVDRQAIVAAGAGWRSSESSHLGRGLVLGGTDAYQMLARRCLAEGKRADARTLFRVLVERSIHDPAQGPPWALRGWGLALLPKGVEPVQR